MYRIDVPEKVEHIIDTLTAAGHEAYAVGGCVRDALETGGGDAEEKIDELLRVLDKLDK